jgi:hypothetical protein
MVYGYLDLWQFSGDPIPLLPSEGKADAMELFVPESCAIVWR